VDDPSKIFSSRETGGENFSRSQICYPIRHHQPSQFPLKFFHKMSKVINSYPGLTLWRWCRMFGAGGINEKDIHFRLYWLKRMGTLALAPGSWTGKVLF
jgi:hypothetical protein